MIRRIEDAPDVLTAAEVAEILQISKPYVYWLGRQGLLRSKRLGKAVRFNRADVEEFIASTADVPGMQQEVRQA